MTRVELIHRELVAAMGYADSPTMAGEMWDVAERINAAIRLHERKARDRRG